MFELVFSRKANQTFDTLQEQILNKWGESSLIKFEKRVYDVLLILSESPFVYKEVESYLQFEKPRFIKTVLYFIK
ncbi:hypothetical protein A0256_09265 [Mucilaginibacter sp. PAMC 26640]|nr:hypothetical protein A0256_09265 [Mucilaginibacter sp. PAMC 26640]